MKRHLVLTALAVATVLTACGGNKGTEKAVQKIEAGDTAESKAPTERKYEETKTVVAPEKGSEASGEESSAQSDEQEASIDWTPSVYGNWYSQDGTSITIFNSTQGVKFKMFNVVDESFISADATTDNKSYVEIKYKKPVEPVESAVAETTEQVEEVVEQVEETTVKFTVDKMDYDKETSVASLTLTGDGKTYELTMDIYADTPDLSVEDNALAKDMLVDEDSASEEQAADVQ